MPTKAEMYVQMAEQAARQLTGSWQEWAGFLTTAARLYKYPFHEQLMIYAQRPDATACAEYDLWNEKMGAVCAARLQRHRPGGRFRRPAPAALCVRYFRHRRPATNSRAPWLWQLEEQHTWSPVSGHAGTQLRRCRRGPCPAAGAMWPESWRRNTGTDHQQDLLYIVDGSFLEEYDELNVEVQFKAAATVSITYALMSRCGLEPEQLLSATRTLWRSSTSTPRPPSGRWERQSARSTSRCCGRSASPSRTMNAPAYRGKEHATHGEQPDLHAERGLPDSRPEA